MNSYNYEQELALNKSSTWNFIRELIFRNNEIDFDWNKLSKTELDNLIMLQDLLSNKKIFDLIISFKKTHEKFNIKNVEWFQLFASLIDNNLSFKIPDELTKVILSKLNLYIEHKNYLENYLLKLK